MEENNIGIDVRVCGQIGCGFLKNDGMSVGSPYCHKLRKVIPVSESGTVMDGSNGCPIPDDCPNKAVLLLLSKLKCCEDCFYSTDVVVCEWRKQRKIKK